MKRLSALLVGAFMLVGANSVIALEGGASANEPMLNSAISAVRYQVQEVRTGDDGAKCFTVLVGNGSMGQSLENTCLNTESGNDGIAKFELPEIINPQN